MNVFRIDPQKEERGLCHNCHNKALIDVNFGSKHPRLRLCPRCSGFLGRTLLQRLEEDQKGMPIPKPAREEDARGNR